MAVRDSGTTRRDFLRGAALAAAPLILPSGLFGEWAPSRTLNVGIVGCGVRWNTHYWALAGIPGVRIAAVCDVWDKRSRACREKVNGQSEDTACKAYRDYRELCADPGVDVVTIATPDHWHALIAVEAANQGKHIYLEKPFAYSIPEGRAVIEAVDRNGVVLQYGTQQRSLRSFQHMTYLARHGYLGELQKAYAVAPPGPSGGNPGQSELPAGLDWDFFVGPAPRTPFYEDLVMRTGTPGWYFHSVFCAGWLTAWGSHHVDSAQFALGKDHEAPVKVEATGRYPAEGVFDTLQSWYAEFTYADGKKLIYCTSDRPERPAVRSNSLVIGSEGWAGADREKVYSNPEYLANLPLPHDDPMLRQVATGGQDHHFANFIDAIRYGRALNAPMNSGHLSTSLCCLAAAAVKAQRPLTWKGPVEQFEDDPVANRLLSRPMRAPWSLA